MRARLLLAVLCLFASLPGGAQVNEVRPPFVTTPLEVVDAMLRLAKVSAADTLIDLGSGDGRIVIAAARDFGATATGVELDENLVRVSQRAAQAAGVSAHTRFFAENALRFDLSSASVVTVYLLPSLMDQLQARFLDSLRPGTRIVSHAFTMTGWRPDRSETVPLLERHPSQGDTSILHLWVVPAQVRGAWAGEAAGLGAIEVRIEQNFQQIELAMRGGEAALEVREARLSGAEIGWRAGGAVFRGRVNGAVIEGLAGIGGRELPFRLERRVN
ncbi:MAG TPA: methyltransferase domain-containing protein [Burkholderiales bacterium]